PPAAASAVNSPSDNPAAASNVRPGTFSFSISKATQLTRKIAGCAFSVLVSSASGPSKQILVRSYPSAALARSNHAAAEADDSASDLPMPTACAPCPANNKAAFINTGALNPQPHRDDRTERSTCSTSA